MFDREKLNALMESRSVTQKELAEAIGKSDAAVSYIRRGLNEPSLRVAKRIAKYFGVAVDDLIKEEEEA